MDALLALAALLGPPARIDARTVWYASPHGVVALPVAVLPPGARAARLLAEERLGLGQRVAAAMEWGEDAQALRAAAGWARPLPADGELDAALRRWSDARCRGLGLAPDAPLAAIGGDGRPRAPTPEERAALGDAIETLAPLAWPRWRGPLVLVPHGIDHPLIAAGAARVLRPALPVLRPPGGGRAELAVAIADLALALSAPPAGGWPTWLTAGVAGCAEARAVGTGLPERALAERRAAAGEAAIVALLADGSPPDRALATAVVGGLLHPTRRARLPQLLDLLRHGVDGVGAVRTAYGLSPAALAADPSGAPPR
jgi:hypothetical protein